MFLGLRLTHPPQGLSVAPLYHLDWLDDCDVAEQADYLEEMKGYQMGKRFTLCESCKEILIDIRP
jgi:hypothetical protein